MDPPLPEPFPPAAEIDCWAFNLKICPLPQLLGIK